MENYSKRYATLMSNGQICWGIRHGKNHIFFDFEEDMVGIIPPKSFLSFGHNNTIHWEEMEQSEYFGEYIYDYVNATVIKNARLNSLQISSQAEMIKEGEAKFLIFRPIVNRNNTKLYKYYNPTTNTFCQISDI